MPTTWYTAHVIEIKDIARNVRSFTIEIKDIQSFNFKAGQFITFDLPVGEKRLQRWKSYSIANAPDEGNKLELCIVHYENGLGSSYFFNEVKIGTELKFKGPEGGFILPESFDLDLVMICTGTGIAPFRSMLQDIVKNQTPFKKIHLIFGTRTLEDLLYYDELQHFVITLPEFKFDIALSREKTLPINSNFHSGYVHQVYLNEYQTVRTDIQFFICGWSKMIDEAVENLFSELKYDRKQIVYELYG